MKRKTSSNKQSDGFTILELLIATTIFSVILLLVSNGVIQIGRLYYKGITTSKTQETTRAVSGEISRTLQLNNVDIDSKLNVICMGVSRYTYTIDRRIENVAPTSATTRHALWFDTARKAPGDPCTPVDLNMSTPSINGRELLSANMRLLHFDVRDLPINTTFAIDIRIAYGDDVLLSHRDENTGVSNGGDPKTANCRATNSGGSFCAVSQLDTTVQRRVN